MLHSATHLRLTVIATLVALGTSGLCAGQEAVNLLRNGGAELAEGDQPSFWFAAAVPAEGLRMWRTTDQSHGGEAALAISNEHEYEQQVCNNWAQNVRDVPVDRTVVLSAYVKTEQADSVSLCIQCWDQTKRQMLAFGSTPVLRGSQDWAPVQSQPVLVPPGTSAITVRAVLTGKGQVCFDDLALNVIETGAGATTSDTGNLLGNPGAEQGVDGEPMVWFAAQVPVEGLRLWRATDERHSGAASLAISNTHEYDQRVCNNWAQKVWNVPVGRPVVLSGYIKTENAKAVNLCIQCWNEAEDQMVAFGSTPVLSDSQDWTLVSTQPVFVPAETAVITVRAVLTGTGKVWFDDLALKVVDLGASGLGDARLDGMWSGHELGHEELMWTAVFCGQNMILVCSSGEAGAGRGVMDTSKQPHEIDAVAVCACPYTDMVGAKALGIYAIEDDVLTMCLNAPGDANRPADFGARGSRTLVLTRQK
jgi:uncharacterized protein (TIGR03067 family)